MRSFNRKNCIYDLKIGCENQTVIVTSIQPSCPIVCIHFVCLWHVTDGLPPQTFGSNRPYLSHTVLLCAPRTNTCCCVFIFVHLIPAQCVPLMTHRLVCFGALSSQWSNHREKEKESNGWVTFQATQEFRFCFYTIQFVKINSVEEGQFCIVLRNKDFTYDINFRTGFLS